MTAEQLRNSILQEAISGRLVPQDPNDEPASVLLQHIREEKERLVKEGKLKKKDLVETPIAEDKIPFELPKGWVWARLKTIVYNHGQKTPSNKFSYIDIGSIDNKRQLLNPKETIIEAKDAPSRARKIVVEGDIVYSTVRPYLHNMAIIDKTFAEEPIASTGFAVFSCHIGLLNKYLFAYLLSPCFDSYANDGDNAKGVAYPAINDDKLYKAIIPLPPLAEQKRIVAKLEELLPIVEQYGKAQKELEELNAALPARLRQSILQEAISGRLVPQDPNDEPASVLLKRLRVERYNRIKLGKIKLSKPEKALKVEITNDFELPSSWTWCVLNDVCRAFGRIGFRGYTKNDIVTNKENGAIAISPSNMVNNRLKLDVCTYISEAKYLESPEIMVENGDILLTKTASVGKLALVEDLPWKATINPQIAVLKEISIDRKYLTWALASPYIQDIIHGFTIGTSIPTYSQEKMIGINIPLPPLAEQQRIVAKIEELFEQIDKISK